MNSAVSSVLNQFLGEYFEGLNPEQFNLSVFAGKVELGPLKVKKAAVDKLGLPLQLVCGVVRRVHATIPWTSLRSKPLVVEVEDVYILAEPKPASGWSETTETRDYFLQKSTLLDQLEVLNSESLQPSSESGYFSKLVATILANIQLKISHLYIRLEDRTSSVQSFALGLVLEQIEIVTCDSSFKPAYVTGGDTTYKLGDVRNFGLFLDYREEDLVTCCSGNTDLASEFEQFARVEVRMETPHPHRYIISPTGLLLRLVLPTDAAVRGLPLAEATFLLGHQMPIQLTLSTNQLLHLVKLSEFCAAYDSFRAGIVSKLDTMKWTDEEVYEYYQVYKSWHGSKHDKSTCKTLSEKLSSLEVGHGYEEISGHRHTAFQQFLKEHAEMETQRKNNARSKTEKILTSVKSWFSSAPTSPVTAPISPLTRIQTDFSPPIDPENIDLTPKTDSTRYLLTFEMSQFIIILQSETQSLLGIVQEATTWSVTLRDYTVKYEGTLGELVVHDEVVKSELYPYIFKSGLLRFAYETHRNGVTDVIVRAERAHVVANLPCVVALQGVFQSSFSGEFDIEYYKKAAGETVAGYMDSGRKYMEDIMKGNYSHQSMNLDVDFAAPCVLVPMEIERRKECLVLDFGRLLVTSDLIDCTACLSSPPDSSLLYDVYHIQLKDMKVGVLWDFCTSESTITYTKFSPLFSPSPITIDMGNALNTDFNAFPAIFVRIYIAEIAFSVDDEQLLFLLRLKDTISEQFGEQEPPKLDKKTSSSIFDDRISAKTENPLSEKEIFQHFQLSIGNFHIKISKFNVQLSTFSLTDTNLILTMTSSGDFISDFYINKLEIVDCRPVFFHFVLSRTPQDSVTPLDIGEEAKFPYHSREMEKFLPAQSQAQVCFRVKMIPKERINEVFVAVSDVRLVLTCDFVKEMMAFQQEPMQIAAQEAVQRRFKRGMLLRTTFTRILTHKSMNLPVIPCPEVRKSCIERNLLVTLQVQGVETWVLESSKAADSRILGVDIEAMARYNSYQKYTCGFDQFDSVLYTDYTLIDDEASIDVTKIGVIQGYYKNNKLGKVSADKEDLLQPCRLEVEYTVRKRSGPERREVNVHVEALSCAVGFREITCIRQLVKAWSGETGSPQPTHARNSSAALSSVSDPPPDLPKDDLIYKLDFKCDSCEVVIVDDTGIRVLSLACLEMHNISAEMEYSSTSLQMDCSTSIKTGYYNSQVAIWEPITEDWWLEIMAAQSKETEPVQVSITSNGPLNVNLSYAMAETVALMQLKLSQDSSQWGKDGEEVTVTETDMGQVAGSQIVYKVKNRLGVGVKAWLEGVPETYRQEWGIPPNKTYRFGQALIDSARMKGMETCKRKYACLTQTAEQASEISLEVHNQGLVSSVVLNDIGTRSFEVKDPQGNTKTTVVVDISSRGGERIVSLESAVKVINNSDLQFEVTHKDTVIPLKPTRAFTIPLDWLSDPLTLNTVTGPVDILTATGCISLTETECIVLDTVVIQSGECDDLGNVTIPHQKVVIINAAYTVQNLTPAFLSIYSRLSDDPIVTLAPGSIKPVYFFSPTNDREHKWSLEMEGGVKLDSDWFLASNGAKHSFALHGNFPCDKLSVEVSKMMFVNSKDVDLKGKVYVEQNWNSVFAQVYLQFILVNTTPYSLEFTGKKGYLKVPRHSLGTVKEKKAEMSVRLSDFDYGVASDWSRNFNISTAGVSGSLQLNNSAAAASNPSAPNVIQLGVRLSHPGWPLIKTTLVRVQPRYILTNYLDRPLLVRQSRKEGYVALKPTESLPYQFDNAKVHPSIEVGMDGVSWSSPFLLEIIEDFQVRFGANPEEPKPEIKTAEVKRLSFLRKSMETESPTDREAGLEWWKPTLSNDCQRYVRVIISTEDEATLFISFTNPTDPEFQLANMTTETVKVRQEGCKHETTAEPGQKVPFTYDNHLANKKKVAISVGGETEVFPVDKIKTFGSLVAGHRVKVETQGVTRVISIEPNSSTSPSQPQASVVAYSTKQTRFDNFSLKLLCKGLVISFIDDLPCERFVLSIIGISITSIQQVSLSTRGQLIDTDLRVDIHTIQLDNMQAHESQFPVLLSTLDTSDESNPLPCFQFALEKNVLVLDAATRGIEHYKHVGLLIQPVNLQVHKDTIMSIAGAQTAGDKQTGTMTSTMTS